MSARPSKLSDAIVIATEVTDTPRQTERFHYKTNNHNNSAYNARNKNKNYNKNYRFNYNSNYRNVRNNYNARDRRSENSASPGKKRTGETTFQKRNTDQQENAYQQKNQRKS